MTVQEAIKKIKYYMPVEIFDNEAFEAKEMAIQALEEVERYRALGTVEEIIKHRDNLEQENHEYSCIGTVEELKEAIEKQVAVEHHHTRVDNISDKVRKSICPKCLGITYTHREEYPNYCTNCGQKIDWEEGGTSD